MALQSFNNPNSDEARQHLLDRRCERKHPKRHRTLKRSRAQRDAKKRAAAAKVAAQKKARARYLERVRAYWAGLLDGHP